MNSNYKIKEIKPSLKEYLRQLEERLLQPEVRQSTEEWDKLLADELSIVCPQGQLPEYKEAELGWRALKVAGPLDFSLTGVLADLANPLAKAGSSIFALSTYNTDYLLVKEDKLEQAVSTLEASGHEVNKQEG